MTNLTAQNKLLDNSKTMEMTENVIEHKKCNVIFFNVKCFAGGIWSSDQIKLNMFSLITKNRIEYTHFYLYLWADAIQIKKNQTTTTK